MVLEKLYIFKIVCMNISLFYIKINHCYGLNVFVSPKNIFWNINRQWNGIKKWYIWEVIRIKWGHESTSLMNGLVPLL